MRGPLPQKVYVYKHYGITPACAGTTTSFSEYILANRDHPRMCGDHLTFSKHLQSLQGSPPHVRGPRYEHLKDGEEYGITPACAGTTCYQYTNYNRYWDHPRMCGDHVNCQLTVFTPAGSPPHVRGPHYYHIIFCYWRGITPACAGTTYFI